MENEEDGPVHFVVDTEAVHPGATPHSADADAAGMTEEQYYSALLRTIEFAGEDPSRLRRMIYDLARNELRRQLYHRLDFRFLEIKQQTSALERAIEQVESKVGDQTPLLPNYSGQMPGSAYDEAAAADYDDEAPPRLHQALVVNRPPMWAENRGAPIFEGYPALGSRMGPYQKPKRFQAAFWSTLQLFIAVLLGAAVLTVVENRNSLFSHAATPPSDDLAARTQQLVSAEEPGVHSSSATDASHAQPNSTLDSTSNGLPLPRSYGVYALDQGKLINLQSLPIRVPDQRVEISAIFPTPSATTLPDGQLQFIAFRRDLMDQAPDHVLIRVVARVARALTFDKSGAAKTVTVDSSWAVRGKAFQMKVSPVDGKPEMILIQPETAGFALPPGRYALVLLKTSYDFTVAGKVTDPAQCLERTDALNMPVYSECGPASADNGASAE
jgi:hypothetical protein